eukprot:31018-Pelagococcus_subviridis.AAC.8
MRPQKSLRIGVHHADAVVWGPAAERGAHEHVRDEYPGGERAAGGDARDDEEVRQKRGHHGRGEELLAVQLVPSEEVLHDALFVLKHQRRHLGEFAVRARVRHERPRDLDHRLKRSRGGARRGLGGGVVRVVLPRRGATAVRQRNQNLATRDERGGEHRVDQLPVLRREERPHLGRHPPHFPAANAPKKVRGDGEERGQRAGEHGEDDDQRNLGHVPPGGRVRVRDDEARVIDPALVRAV